MSSSILTQPEIRTLELVQALAHPFRIAILRQALQSTGEPFTPRETAQALGVPVNRLGYHFRVLSRAGILNLQESTVLQGSAVEHFYVPCAAAMSAPIVRDVLMSLSG